MDLEHGAAIARELGLDEHGLKVTAVSGGDIARAHVLQGVDTWVFVKSLPLRQGGLLSAEADGLQAIAATGTVRVPRVIRRGMLEDTAWLALEYLELDDRSPRADAALGHQLAEMHRHGADVFGWHRNNYIGRTPQPNTQQHDWTEFFLAHRLGYQFDRLASAHPDEGWDDLKQAVAQAWRESQAEHQPPPALVHGDLWRGNAAAIGGDQPVVFDPAVHYADRETDLAMTRLFGGFSESFYRAYEQSWPLPPGHEQRWLYYKLYHVLNHANLFGGGYLQSAGKVCYRIIGQ